MFPAEYRAADVAAAGNIERDFAGRAEDAVHCRTVSVFSEYHFSMQ
jgi:hypothetical protein